MNNVILMGRVTADVTCNYTKNKLAVAKFNVALDRGRDKDGESKGADFPQIVVFGKSAENCERYIKKGARVCVRGHINTDSYTNKDGQKVYVTNVIAENVEFIDWKSKDEPEGAPVEEFVPTTEDIPF